MKLTRSLLTIAFGLSLVFVSFLTFATQSVSAQDTKLALQRGYRTGYSDGYMSGYRDSIENTGKSYERHSEYTSADRAFTADYGNLNEYKDGYQQGFEKGYDTGYEKQSFDATIPAKLAARGIVNVKQSTTLITKEPINSATTAIDKNVAVNTTTVVTGTKDSATKVVEAAVTKTTTATLTKTDAPVLVNRTEVERSGFSGDEIVIIPTDTELVIELDKQLDTKKAREGDFFTATIVSPVEIEGAKIEGRIVRNREPGRIKRRAELLLSFDRIKLSESRWSNFNAIIVEILPMKGDNVKRIDEEGVVEGTRPVKKDSLTIGGATGTGLVIGAVVGGPVGAAVGAGVGAAFGVGAVVVDRGQYIVLQQNQQMRIRTVYETQIR
ncbi:MAG: hypothetical protein ACK5NT_12095 [Pyrinomonadaceae bacterium]